MRRFIKILQELQNNSQSLSLSYLTEKFSITIRTLQRDIQRINVLLSEISDCKIIKRQDQLILIGVNSELAINNLLSKFLTFSNNDEIKDYLLLLNLIWENQPLSNAKLLNFTNGSLYNLKQEIGSINNFFQYYQLNLSLKFKSKKGWILVGCEQDLRLLATNILIKLYHSGKLEKNSYPTDSNSYLFANLFYLSSKLEKLLATSSIFQSYYPEILYFLILIVKRIKINKSLNNYRCHLLLQQLLVSEATMNQECEQLVNLLTRSFALKFNQFERAYLKSLMFINQKQINNKLFFIQINELKKAISELIFKKYQISLAIKDFEKILNNFLLNNYLMLLFNFYQSFNFNDLKKSPFSINNVYYFGWEVLSIINFVFKQSNINVNFNFLVADYLLMSFNNLYLRTTQQNWIIPLYYQENKSVYSELNRILSFILDKYPNINLKSLNINNNVEQWHLLNKSYTILFDDNSNWDLTQYKKIFLIKYHRLISNQQLQIEIDSAINMIMFSKISSSILIFDFFLNQKFYNLKTFLNFFQNFLVRKFKLNLVNFDLKDAFTNWNFCQANILLVHKLIPIDNIELPIILIYLKNPLFFHKKDPIHFIFILITNANNLYQYDWMLLYLNLIKNNFNIKITSSKNLYQMFTNSLPQKSLDHY